MDIHEIIHTCKKNKLKVYPVAFGQKFKIEVNYNGKVSISNKTYTPNQINNWNDKMKNPIYLTWLNCYKKIKNGKHKRFNN